ncbi:pentatricopeptide repeat-containing protein [Tanacetum coccineum]
MGKQVHCLVCKYGLCFDLFVANGLIDMYCKCGSLSHARKLFDEMPERDICFLDEYDIGYRVGDCVEAFSLFRKMSGAGLVPDVATWNAMICGFVQSGETVKGVELFREMLVAGVEPNPVTITGLLPGGNLILGYVKHARNVFDTVSSKNVASWNAMIGCYGKHGMVNSAFELLDQMEDEHVKPNQVTLTCVLASCSHGGMVNKGLTFFKSMRESQRVEIREEHYGCVIDMLCRSGKIEEAYDLVHELDTEVTDSMVGSFLNGCVSYSRPDLAKKVAATLMKIKTNKPGGFVTLSNVYAAEGEWAKVEMLREVMKVQGVQKLPGFSSLSNDI